MSEIFISYRRDDTSGHAIHIAEHLGEKFGADNVFLDTGMRPLEKWPIKIEEALDNAKVIVVLVGKRWLSDRLFDNNDYVRKEIEWGIRRNIRVIPVQLDGAVVPATHLLPAEIRALVEVQAIQLSSTNSEQYFRDLSLLSMEIEKILLGDSTKSRFNNESVVSSDVAMLSFHRDEKDKQRFDFIDIYILNEESDLLWRESVVCGHTNTILLPTSTYGMQARVRSSGSTTTSLISRKKNSDKVTKSKSFIRSKEFHKQWTPGLYKFEIGITKDWQQWIPVAGSFYDKCFIKQTDYQPWTHKIFLSSISSNSRIFFSYEGIKHKIWLS